jgi:lipid A 4'-phosphatase
MKKNNKKKLIMFDFLFPFGILFFFTSIFWLTNLDVALEKFFYLREKGWIYKNNPLVRFSYHYAPLPALGAAIGALLIFIASFWIQSLVPYRKVTVFCVLLMMLGPGLVINGIFKATWGRPRPSQINTFSGQNKFTCIWKKGASRKYQSFPSGHASMGFFFLFPFFFFRRRSRKWAVIFLALGFSYGIIIGLARMMQGAHFASDIVWSAGFVYLCGLILYYMLRLNQDIWFRPRNLEEQVTWHADYRRATSPVYVPNISKIDVFLRDQGEC